MNDISYGGKTLDECLQIVNDAAEINEVGPEILMFAVESLMDSSDDIIIYFNAYIDVCKTAIEEAIKNGQYFEEVIRVIKGYPLIDQAEDLAYMQLRLTINHYNDSEIHEKWNAALPNLETYSSCATLS